MNVYKNPEQFRLRLLGVVDWVGPQDMLDPLCAWECDLIGVWHDATEERFYVGDSMGCECSLGEPFADMGRDHLVEVTGWEMLDEFLIGVFETRMANGDLLLDQVTRIAQEIGALEVAVRALERPPPTGPKLIL